MAEYAGVGIPRLELSRAAAMGDALFYTWYVAGFRMGEVYGFVIDDEVVKGRPLSLLTQTNEIEWEVVR